MTPMQFIHIPRDRTRPPFEADPRFRAGWWDRWPAASSSDFCGVEIGGVEVARIQLVEAVYPEEYVGVPSFGRDMLKIQLLEVAVDRRREGIGTRVVHALGHGFPGRRFEAFSEGADEFWMSLGWERFEHPDGRHQLLFIEPAKVTRHSRISPS